jgi:hypothetical protein
MVRDDHVEAALFASATSATAVIPQSTVRTSRSPVGEPSELSPRTP